MRKTSMFLVVVLLANQLTWSQSSIYIEAGGNLFISSTTLFFVDSMALVPSLDFDITGENAVTRNTTVIHTTSNSYIKRVFNFLNTLPVFNGAVSVYYTDDELNGIAENTLTLNVHNGTKWNAFVTGVTRDGVNNFVSTSGLNNVYINELTLAGLSSPLPVKFTFFNAACLDGDVILNWQTATEADSRSFEIQTSTNGNNWQAVGTVPAAGNSSTLLNYNFTVINAIANSLYRVVQYDLNGTFAMSSTLKPNCTGSGLFMVYPNPVQSALAVIINVKEATTINLKLYDARGAVVKNLQRNLFRGTNRLDFDMKELAAGFYMLQAQWGTYSKQLSIIKQ